MCEEKFVPVNGYCGYYEISANGNVKSCNRTILYKDGKKVTRKAQYLKPGKTDGYLTVALCKNNKPITHSIHRLLCIHFLPNPLNLSSVNHKNGIRDDNRLDNLEWVTHQENLIHAKDILRMNTGLTCRLANLNKSTLRQLYSDLFVYNIKTDCLVEKYNLTYPAIINIKKGRRYKNEFWEFFNSNISA